LIGGYILDNNTAIEINNLTIRFNLASEKVDNLKEYFIKLLKHQLMFQEFLALKDINATIKKGESWGLIGTNGSGKSTLLKAISGILKPYKGYIKVNGNIAPLIELGAGFDPDLTARENIYLNGTVLGHSKKFMNEHFDEIVDFAEIQEFLDSPVKNFSSGMQARLGFSVATMVRPEILIVDEVLAVGDYSFQKKCMKRMEDMISGGTTLIFVSHSIEQVMALCNHALWLDKGSLVMVGDADTVCKKYILCQDQK
jgi:lipopolysaccharide transport system ATP-binding protein